MLHTCINLPRQHSRGCFSEGGGRRTARTELAKRANNIYLSLSIYTYICMFVCMFVCMNVCMYSVGSVHRIVLRADIRRSPRCFPPLPPFSLPSSDGSSALGCRRPAPSLRCSQARANRAGARPRRAAADPGLCVTAPPLRVPAH